MKNARKGWRTARWKKPSASKRAYASVDIRTAAERGDIASQTYLAGCYARGILVPLDYDEALKWFRRAAILGDEKAKEAVRMLEQEKATAGGETSASRESPGSRHPSMG